MDVEIDTPAGPPPRADLIAALEQATLMAKQLPTTTDPSHLLQIHNSLHSAHRHLSLFLSHHHHPPPPPPPPQPTPPPENSYSSAVGGGIDEDYEIGGGEPMEMEDEQNSKATASTAVNVSTVEERMRECCIQNKRPKRQLSPSALAAERQRSYGDGVVGSGALASESDPLATKLRCLDLIYQFHA